MTFERKRLSVDEAVERIAFHPPMDEWRLLVTPSYAAVRRVAGAVVARVELNPELPFARMQDLPDADLFLRVLKGSPHHALIFTVHPAPSNSFWQKLDKARPRLRRAAPMILVITEEVERDLRTCASHLSSWFSGRSLHVHDESSPDSDTLRVTLYDKLVRLLPSQFDEVVLRLALPTRHLPSAYAPPSDRALAVIHLLEQRKRLDELDLLLVEMSIHLR